MAETSRDISSPDSPTRFETIASAAQTESGYSNPIINKSFSEKEWRKVENILHAAAVLFDRNGYIETSLKDISAEAEVSKGGIYHYFSSKHEILFCIIDTYLDKMLGNVEEEIASLSDPDMKVRHLMDRHLALYASNPPEMRAMLNHTRVLPPEELRYVTEKQKRYAGMLAGILAEMTDRTPDPRRLTAITYFIFGMYNSIMHWHKADGEISIEEIGEICFKLLMDGWHSMSKTNLISASR